MTEKCCLNCAYLSRPDETSEKISWDNHLRQQAGPDEVQLKAHCYHKQWMAYPSSHQPQPDILAERLYPNMTPSNEWKVSLTSGSFILLKQHNCNHFHAYDPADSKPLDRIWEDKQKNEEHRRFWIPTGISIAAIMIAGLSLWRSWQ
jgi:hypothetical protein